MLIVFIGFTVSGIQALEPREGRLVKAVCDGNPIELI